MSKGNTIFKNIGYGPDLQRVESSLGKTYNNLYHKFFWDDYEEKVVGSDTLHYYYVSGTDGLAGLHIDILPSKPYGYYHEYMFPTPGVSGPGHQRIVTGNNGEIYYSPDHYHSFMRIR